MKSSRKLIVVSCSERGWIQIYNIATKEMITELMLNAQREAYSDIEVSIIEHDFENFLDSIDQSQIRHCAKADK